MKVSDILKKVSGIITRMLKKKRKKKQLRTTAGHILARLISENSVDRTAKYFS